MAHGYIRSSSSSHPNIPAGYSNCVGGQQTVAQVSHAYPATGYSVPPSQSVVSHSTHHGGYLDVQQGYGFERCPVPYSNAPAPYQNHHFQLSSMSNPQLDTVHTVPFTSHGQPVSGQLQGTYIGQDTHSFAHRATPPAGIASTASHPHAYHPHMSLAPVLDSGINRATTVQRSPQRTSAAARFAPSSSTASRSPRTFEDHPSPNPTNAVSSTPTTTTYTCRWSPRGRRCGGQVEGEKNSIAQHLRDCHDFICDEEQMTCRWDQCDMVLQRRNIARHIYSYHLGVKVLCKHCGMTLSRQDANRKHEKSCASAPKAGAAVYPVT